MINHSLFVCLLGLLIVPTLVRGQSQEPLPFSLDYSAPRYSAPHHTAPDSTSGSYCPERKVAFQMIRKRSRRVRLTRKEDAAQHLRMRITQTANGFQGELTVIRNNEAADSRLIRGSTCTEVVDALALTAALSLDPDAKILPLTSGNQSSTSDSGADADSGANGDSANGDSAPGDNADSETDESNSAKKPADIGESSNSSSALPVPLVWHFSAGVQGSVERVMDTSWHLGAGLALGLRRLDNRVWFPFEFAMDLRYLGEIARAESELASRLGVARFSYCMLRLGTRVSLLACPTAQLGLLVVQGENLDTMQAVNRLYATAGLQARIRARLYKQLEAQFITSLNLPLVPRHFAVDPGPTVIGSTTPIAFDAAIALNWLF